MAVSAKLKNARISPQKVRVVADMIRGSNATFAYEQLEFSCKKAAKLLLGVLKSCMANAEHNAGLDIDNLFLSKVTVDKAGSFKRMRARAKGRGNRIEKANSHICIELAERN